jgi:hypothetical protein
MTLLVLERTVCDTGCYAMSTAKHLPVDQLATSPQCGFSSDIELVQLPKDVRWRKFESLHCRAGLKN